MKNESILDIDADEALNAIHVDNHENTSSKVKFAAFCTCSGAKLANGIAGNPAFDYKTLVLTRCSDSETCDYCGFYVFMKKVKV